MYDLSLRRAYILGTHFDKQMFNVYEGMQNNSRPPFLDDLLNEGTSIQAAIALEKNKHLYQGNDEDIREWNELVNTVWHDDSMAKFEVLDRLSLEDQRDILQDIFVYMDYFHMSYLVRKHLNQPPTHAELVNPPVTAIW